MSALPQFVYSHPQLMKRISLPAVLALSVALITGCESTGSGRKPPKPGGWHPPAPTQPVNPPDDPAPTEDPAPPDRPPQQPDNPKPPEPTVKVGDLPYAKPVPGKPGFVTSPFAPYQGYIDVRGFPPGTEVKDPYSGKTFLVP